MKKILAANAPVALHFRKPLQNVLLCLRPEAIITGILIDTHFTLSVISIAKSLLCAIIVH
jgi:hypothetical protein